jgi:hypothetical protein
MSQVTRRTGFARDLGSLPEGVFLVFLAIQHQELALLLPVRMTQPLPAPVFLAPAALALEPVQELAREPALVQVSALALPPERAPIPRQSN